MYVQYVSYIQFLYVSWGNENASVRLREVHYHLDQWIRSNAYFKWNLKVYVNKWESHRQRSLTVLQSIGSQRVTHDWNDLARMWTNSVSYKCPGKYCWNKHILISRFCQSTFQGFVRFLNLWLQTVPISGEILSLSIKKWTSRNWILQWNYTPKSTILTSIV